MCKSCRDLVASSLLCRFKPEIEIENPAERFGGVAVELGRAQKSDIVVVNPAERFGGVAVVLVQARNCKSA